MRALLALLLLAVAVSAQAQPRTYDQAELDALLAPIALYPDPLLSQVLVAATYPDEVREAAAWSRANAHLKGDEVLRAAEALPWDPSVKALLAYPDLLARMDESPQWTADLGAAFLAQEPQVMATVQALRQRAQASGFLQSDGYQSVEQHSSYIAVQPVHSQIVYLPWYNPLVVYGPWRWHSHRPFMWRPWHPRPAAFVSLHLHRPTVDWHRHRIHRPVRVHRPTHVHRPVQVHRPGAHIQPRIGVHENRSQSRKEHRSEPRRARDKPAQIHGPARIHNHVHQAQRARPIVQGAQIQPRFGVQENRSQFRREHPLGTAGRPVQVNRPANIRNQVQRAQTARPIVRSAQIQPRFGAHDEKRSQFRKEHRSEPRRAHRGGQRNAHRQHSRGNGRGRN